MSTPPDRPASPGGASSGGTPAGMPARLWEAAKHGDRGEIPAWVQDAPDAGATAPPHISQLARRAAQAAAVAGAIGGGIGIGILATETPAHSAGFAPSGGTPAADHISVEHVTTEHFATDHGAGPLTSTVTNDPPGSPDSGSEHGVTLHTSGEGGHVSSGLSTTWRIPGHSTSGSGHGPGGGVVEHDGLTIEIYQDVVVNQGADGMYSVDAVEYVVVKDEHGHSYVFSDNYHTVVPDPPGQETDLVIHETDHVKVTEHPDGSFSVNQADNSISVTAGADGDGTNSVTVTQSETVQIGHDSSHADGHDTSTLTENEDGATTSGQTEVVASDAPLPPGQEPPPPAPGQVPVPPGQLPNDPSAPSGTTSGHESASPGSPGSPGSLGSLGSHGVFAGLHGGPADPAGGTTQAGHFPGGPVTTVAAHPAGGTFSTSSGSAVSKPFEDPAPSTAGTPSADSHAGTTLAGHDHAGLDDTGTHTSPDPVAVDPVEHDPTAGTHSSDLHGASGYEDAAAAHPDSPAGSADAAEHDPGTDTVHLH